MGKDPKGAGDGGAACPILVTQLDAQRNRYRGMGKR